MARGRTRTPPDPEISRQKRAGQVTRQRSRDRLVAAAAEVFAEKGYTGATVTAIADRAGVSLQTLYTAWGSKRQLLRAYVELSLTGSPTAVTDDTWLSSLHDRMAGLPQDDPQARLRLVGRVYREIAERMALPWRLVRDAAAVDPEVADEHLDLEQARRRNLTGLLTGIDAASLTRGMTFEEAVDTMMVLLSPGAYEILVEQCGYSLDRYETWLGDTLTAALLDPAARTATRRRGSER